MSADGAAGGGRARLWGFRVVVLLMAASVAWLSVRNALHGLLERDYPMLAIALAPASAVAQSEVALNRAIRHDGVVDARGRALLQAALRRSPLMGEPLLVAGLDASANGQLARARALFEEAQHRDPRSVVPRYWLLDDDLRLGRYAAGLDEAGPIMRLQPAAATAVMAVVTALIDVPQARPALVAALRGNPGWRDDFFRQVSATPRLRQEAPGLLRSVGFGAAGAGGDDQQAVVAGMAARGDYAGARALWAGSLPAEFRNRAGVYDGDFAGWPGAAPFNWRLFGTRAGLVARASAPDGSHDESGLAIHVGNDAATPIAEQTVVVSPGPYGLSFATRALPDRPASDAVLRARVLCAPTRKPLGTASVERWSPQLAATTLDVAVPATCPAVAVRFDVAPGMTPGPLAAFLTGVRLTPR